MGIIASSMNTEKPIKFDLDIPETCPHCRRRITPALTYVAANCSDDGHAYTVSAYWNCNGCSEVFCCTYYILGGAYDNPHRGRILSTLPPVCDKTFIDPRITAISPRFTELFNQSEEAKARNLTDLAGMGFRKSLEFLLKDSLIALGMEEESKVVGMDLRTAIASFSDNPRLIKAANLARVIGNEYTHYQAKYEGYDLDTLQHLISIALHWLTMEIETIELEPLTKKT